MKKLKSEEVKSGKHYLFYDNSNDIWVIGKAKRVELDHFNNSLRVDVIVYSTSSDESDLRFDCFRTRGYWKDEIYEIPKWMNEEED